MRAALEVAVQMDQPRKRADEVGFLLPPTPQHAAPVARWRPAAASRTHYDRRTPPLGTAQTLIFDDVEPASRFGGRDRGRS